MKGFFEKHLLIKYVLGGYIKNLLYSLAILVSLFAVLQATSLYAQIESALDIKYNSPFIMVPLYGFVALSLVCLFIGFLMYIYKYKRPIAKGAFYKAFSALLDENGKN